MFVLFVVSAFAVAALGSAQTELNIPSTFTATGEVEWHLPEGVIFGTFTIARDSKAKMGLEEVLIKFEEKDNVEKVIQRYDLATAVYVRGAPTAPSCNNQTRNGTMAAFWEWTTSASNEGVTIIRERNYTLYGYSTGDVRLEVILEPGNMIRPNYFNRKAAEHSLLFSFQEFDTGVPDPKLFAVPPECKK